MLATTSPNGHKRAVIYARVSTKDQKEDGYGLDDQVKDCREYAERMGLEAVATLQEDISGTVPFAERPNGSKAIALLKAHEADAVLVHRGDRLSRDMIEGLIAGRLIIKLGKLHVADYGEVPSDDDIAFVIGQWKAQKDRKQIIKNLAGGRNRKAESGKVVGQGLPPFGYVFARDSKGKVSSLAEVPDDAGIVRMIFDWYTKDLLKARGIAQHLTELHITTPGERHGRFRKQGPGIWDNTSIWAILTDETYAGLWHYRKNIGKNGQGGMRPKSEQIAVNVPAIVDRATWQRAQAQIRENRLVSRRNAKYDYPLRGHVRCGCDAAMTGGHLKPRGRVYRYYFCQRVNRYYHGCQQRPCNAKRFPADDLERLTLDYIAGIIRNRDDFARLLREAQANELAQIEPKREALETVLEQIAQSEKGGGRGHHDPEENPTGRSG